jgi:hypothetical protein
MDWFNAEKTSRIKLREPEQFRRNKMNKFPILLIVKFYWWRLTVISIIWFVYVSANTLLCCLHCCHFPSPLFI